MKLSDLEKRLLSIIGLRGDAPLTELAHLAKTTSHKCRYALENLFERKLVRRRVLINPYKLGYSITALCFSLNTAARPNRDKIVAALIRAPQVGYLGECSGKYEYRADLLSRNSNEIQALLSHLTDRFGATFGDRRWSSTIEIWDFPMKRFDKEGAQHAGWRIGLDGVVVELDERDHTILKSLCKLDTLSHMAIARSLAIPPATFEFRVKRLREQKIITGYHIWPSAEHFRQLGMQTKVFRLRLSKQKQAICDQLEDFARKHPFVFSYTKSIGDYDAELCTLIADAQYERKFTHALEKLLGDSLFDLDHVEIREHLKVWNYPGVW